MDGGRIFNEVFQFIMRCLNYEFTWDGITFTLWNVLVGTVIIAAAGSLLAVGLDRE